MFQKPGNNFWLVAIISLIILFFNLGGIPLLDPDEPVYAETPKEMYAFNEFGSPRIYGQYWYDKPPMYYWLVAASYKLFGITEFSARFPSALLGVICCLALYQSIRRQFSERVALLSALVLASSIEFFYLGKAAVTDMTLLLTLTMSLLAFMEQRYYLAYFFAALATVTKGPIGLLFPGAIVFPYIILTRQWSLLKAMKIPTGLLLYAAVALPWYIMMYQIHGNAFIDTFLGFHNITRFTSPEHPEAVLWYYYIPVLMLGFFPWTAVMLQSMWRSLTDGREHVSRLLFLNIWAIFIFMFFTISRTKLVSYILPMYPPLAVLAGWYIDRLWQESAAGIASRSRLLWGTALSLLTLLFIGGMVAGLKAMPVLSQGIYLAMGVFAVMAAAVVYFLRQKAVGRAFAAQIAGMMVFSFILVGIMFPLAAPYFTTKNMAKSFTAVYDGQAPVYIMDFLHPGFTFYTDVYGSELKSSSDLIRAVDNSRRAYFVIRDSDYRRLPEAQMQQLIILNRTDDKILLLKE